MANMKENPRYNVVSIRLNDEERKALMEVCKETNKSVSKMMREVVSKLCAKGLNYSLMNNQHECKHRN